MALEISRLLFRSGVRGVVMLGFAGAGLVAHTAFLYYQAVKAVNAGRRPCRAKKTGSSWPPGCWSSVYLVPRGSASQGSFRTVPAAAGAGADRRGDVSGRRPSRLRASRPRKSGGRSTASSIMLAAVAVLVGFVAGLMYLGQSRRLKHKRLPAGRLRLPSLEWLATGQQPCDRHVVADARRRRFCRAWC